MYHGNRFNRYRMESTVHTCTYLLTYFILYLAWHIFCSLMLISLSSHMVTWSDGSPLFYIFPFESGLTLFAPIEWHSVSYPASWPPPPLDLVRLGLKMPCAGIGPRLIFHVVRRFEMGIHSPPKELPLSWRAGEPYYADALPLRRSDSLSIY